MNPPSRRSASPGAVLFLIWLPLAAMFALAASQLSSSALDGMWWGIRNAVIAGGLMGSVWWWTGRVPWPDRPGLGFYLLHLGAAAVFALTWRLALAGLHVLRGEGAMLGALWNSLRGPEVPGDLLLRAAIYGLVAGVSYVLRETDRARAERLRTAELAALASRAQLSALQAQLNPHFLFNTLHSLTVLIREAPDRAGQAVERLGELLQFVLRHLPEHEVPLREECAFVENYLALEQLRFEGRLRVVVDIEPEALAVLVPPFCLQPLVENAIRHGIGPRPAGGTLMIAARRTARSLQLEVRDDGVGAVSGNRGGGGTGLVSLRERIEAHAGGQVTITTAPGKGFGVTVRLPVQAKEPGAPEVVAR